MSLLHTLFLSHHSGILPCENGAFLSDLHLSAGTLQHCNQSHASLVFPSFLTLSGALRDLLRLLVVLSKLFPS